MVRYRPEIDGLRAVAVLPVLGFHGAVPGFAGGFVGVDVFFVISGYLITSILMDDIDAGRFSFWRFYERRIRRLLPAFAVVALVTLLAGWALLIPEDFQELGRVLIAASLSVSNIYFWQSSGYFGQASEFDPLRHTWSLSVEEQFYLVFPALLLGLWRLGPRALWIAFAIGATVSLGLALSFAGDKPWAVFYLLPTRAFELLAGAAAALHLRQAAQRPVPLLSAVGLVLLLGAILFLHETVAWPSLWTLIPVVGSVLLILYAAPSEPVGRFLAHPALVGIGLVSYSLYLWHQPLFAYWRVVEGVLPLWAVGLLSAASAVLAALTWRFVEQPFRKPKAAHPVASRGVVGWGIASLAALAIAGTAVAFEQVRPLVLVQRPELASIAFDTPHNPAWQMCPEIAPDAPQGLVCETAGSGDRTWVIWGDSHAQALLKAPDLPTDVRWIIVHHLGCAPSPVGFYRPSQNAPEFCDRPDDLSAALRLVLDLSPDRVILAARWQTYLEGFRTFGTVRNPDYYLVQDLDEIPSPRTARAALSEGIQSIRKALPPTASLEVLLTAPDLSNRSARSRFLGTPVPVETLAPLHASEMAFFDGLGLPMINPRPLFCDDRVCRIHGPDGPFYVDDNHLNARGVSPVLSLITSTGR